MKHLMLLACLLICGHASAAEWVFAGERGSTDIYIDALSVEERGKYRAAWIMLDMAERRKVITVKSAHYRSTKQLQLFDCTKERSGIAQVSFYAANMGKGEVLETYSTARANVSFSKHLPDTLKAMVLEVVCSVPL